MSGVSLTATPAVASPYYTSDNVDVTFSSDYSNLYPTSVSPETIRFTDSSSSLIPFTSSTTKKFASPVGGFTSALSGNLIVDSVIAATSVVSTEAGNTINGPVIDGSPLSAQFSNPTDVAFYGSNAYIVDKGNRVIRRLGLDATFSTAATGGTITYAWSFNTLYAIHTFQTSGTFTFTTPSNISNAYVLAVGAGGYKGSGTSVQPGGGGGGGVAISTGTINSGSWPVNVGAPGIVPDAIRGNGGQSTTFNGGGISVTANGGLGGFNAGLGGGGGAAGFPTQNPGGSGPGGGGGGAGGSGGSGPNGVGGVPLRISTANVYGLFAGGQTGGPSFTDGQGDAGVAGDNASVRGVGLAVISYPIAYTNLGSRVVTKVAGVAGISALNDGTASSATFVSPTGIAFDNSGNCYVGDQNCIRRIDAITGVITTIAGNGTAGLVDAIGSSARLNSSPYLTIDTSNNILYFADFGNNMIRSVNLSTNQVFSLASVPGAYGLVFSNGFIYTTSYTTHTVRRVTVSTGNVTTIAGIGSAGFQNGPGLSSAFNSPTGIAMDPSGNVLVSDSLNYMIRRISVLTGEVSTYAGTGTNGYFDGLGPGARFSLLQGLRMSNSDLFIADSAISLVRKLANYPGVRISPSLTPDNIIIASQTYPIQVIKSLELLQQNPILVGNTTSLYQFEQFLYKVRKNKPGDTLRITNSSAEVLPYCSNDGTDVSFGSVNGFQNSFANSLLFLAEAVSNSVVRESIPITVNVLAGRWIPDIASPYVFSRGQNIGDSYLFSNSLGIPSGNGFTNPSLPLGLSFTRIDASGYVWKLSGTPSLQTTPTVYQFIGRSAAGKIITTNVNITVGPEQLIPSPTSVSFSNLQIGSNVTPAAITVKKPITASGNITWTSTGELPNGLYYADVSGNPFPSQSIMTAFDPSYTVQILGAPTEAAAQSFRATSNFCNVSLIAFVGTLNKTVPLSFQFGQTVLFTNQYTGTPSLFKDVPISIATDVRYTAFSLFGTPFSNAVSSITANALPAGLSLTPLSASSVRVIGTPTTVSSNTYTFTATDISGNTRSVNSSIPILQDVMTVFPPVDVSYVFIQSRDLNNPKTGYYSSPIVFGASSLLNSTSFYSSSYPITFSQSGLGTTGIGLTTVSNTATLSGIPTETLGSTTLTITANDGVASASCNIVISVVPEVYTFTPSNATTFRFLQNEPITPVQFSATTLSERPVQTFLSFDLPSGLNLSPTGLLTGTPINNGVGTFTVTATTGFTSGSNIYAYSTEADNILALLTPVETRLPLGQVFGPTNVKVISRSGSTVSNVTIQELDASYGVVYTSAGVNTGFFSGTMTDGNLATAPLSSNVLFRVRGTVGTFTGDTPLAIRTQNADIFRRYLVRNWYGPNGIDATCYIYSQDDGDQTAFTQRYIGYIPSANTNTSDQAYYYVQTEIGIFDFQIKYPKLSSYQQTSNVILCARNRNFIVRSVDGVTFQDAGGNNGLFSTDDDYRRICQLTYVTSNTWLGIGYRINMYDTDYTLGSVRVYKSTDDGLTWGTIYEFPYTQLAASYAFLQLSQSGADYVGKTCIRAKDNIVMAGGSRSISSGYGPATNSLMRSTDTGTSWSSVTGQFNSETQVINIEGTVWLIGGSDLYEFENSLSMFSVKSDTIRYSTDQGLTWKSTIGDFNFGCVDIVYGEGQWIAYGMSYENGDYRLQFKYSIDGINWLPLTAVASPTPGSRLFTDIDINYTDKIMFDGENWNIYVIVPIGVGPLSQVPNSYIRSFRHSRLGDLSSGWTEFVIPSMNNFAWISLSSYQYLNVLGPPGGCYFLQSPGTSVSTLGYVDGNSTFYDPKV